MLVVVGLGGWLGATGRMTPGDLLVPAVRGVVITVIAGAELFSNWPQASAAPARIAEVLAAEPDVTERRMPGTCRPARERSLRPCRIRYRPSAVVHRPRPRRRRRYWLRSSARAGGQDDDRFLACRFYDPTAGRASRRCRHRRLRLDELRSGVDRVEDTVVFTASICNSLRVGRPEATDAEIERGPRRLPSDACARVARRVRDRRRTAGYSLSGGQW
jgi:hypothetical protein